MILRVVNMDFYEYMDKEIPRWKLCLDNQYVEKIHGEYLYVTNMKLLLKQLHKELEKDNNDYNRENIKKCEEAIQRHSEKLKSTIEIAKQNQTEIHNTNMYDDTYKETFEALETMKRITGFREKYAKDHEEVAREMELARQLLAEQQKPEQEKKL
jgi:hypothetical protein